MKVSQRKAPNNKSHLCWANYTYSLLEYQVTQLIIMQLYNIILQYYFTIVDWMRRLDEIQVCWQGMYMQLALQYSTLAFHYHTITEQNNVLYQEFQRLMNQKIILMKEDIPTQPSIGSPLQNYKNQTSQEITIIKKAQNIKKKKDKVKRIYRRNRIRREGSVYRCTYPDCWRVYHSSVSMNLHIKLKHNGGSKKQREAYAKMLLDSHQRGLNPPNFQLNLPPNFLSEFKQNYQYIKKYNM